MRHRCSFVDQLRGVNRPVAHTPPNSAVRTHIISDERRDATNVRPRDVMPAPGSRAHAVLAALPDRSGKTVERLASDTGLSGSSVAYILQRLHDVGLVERRRNPRGLRRYQWWRIG